MHAYLQSSLLRVRKYFVKISMLQLTQNTFEVGDKIKETGKKIIFSFICFETNSVKTY